MADSEIEYAQSTSTILVLLLVLALLIISLVILYKKLNRDTDGEYTVRRIVYREGGLRDRARSAAVVVGGRLGVQLWPGGGLAEDGEEMQDYRDEEGGVEACGRSEGSDKQEEDDETGGSNTSGDNSSVEGSDGGHSESGATGGEEEGEEKDGGSRDGEGKEEAGEDTGLLVTLSQISGSAIWSGECGDPTDINVTAL